MGFLDAFWGRTRISAPKRDQVFALGSAEPDIQDKLGTSFKGRSAVILRAIEASRFDHWEKDLKDILNLGGHDLPVMAHQANDAMGFRWVSLQHPDLSTCLAAGRLVEELAQESGFPDALLASAFDFGLWILIWSYHRGTFYPFAQTGPNQRDRALEIRVAAQLSPLLPIEKSPDTWYPLWDPCW